MPRTEGAPSPTCFFAELTRAFGPKLEFVDKGSTGLGAMANSTACIMALRWSAKVDGRDESAGETEADRERLCSLSAFPSSASEAIPDHPWHSGKGVLFAVTAHVADMHNERLTMLTLRSLRLFHPAADILVVDNASPSSSGSNSSSRRGGYDSHAFFSQLPAALACAYSGCCDGSKGGVRLHGCKPSSSSALSSPPPCDCCGRVLVQRAHEAGAASKAVGSLREFGALAQAALHVQYLPAADPHHIVLLQSSTGLKRPIAFADLDEATCPFTFLHLPYSWRCCQTNSAADVRMRTARWGLSCSEAAFGRRGFARSFMQSAPNSLWTASSHGAVVMTRGVLARLMGMGIFQLDVLDAMGNGRWCWETSAGLVGAWLAQERRIGTSAASATANASAFSAKGGPLDARCIQPIAYKLHGNNIEQMRDLNPKLQHHFKTLAVHATAEAGKAAAEVPPECALSRVHAALPWRLALHPASSAMTRGGARCAAELASRTQLELRTASSAVSEGTPRLTPRLLSSTDATDKEQGVRATLSAVCRSAQASPLANPSQRHFACGHGVWSCLPQNDVGHGGSLAPSAMTRSLAVQIRKSGSMQISALINLFEKRLQRDRLKPLSAAGREGKAAWTFLREPLARLLSGYADIEGRLVEPHGVCLPFGSNWTRGGEPTHTMLPAAAIGNFSALDASLKNIWTGQGAIAARCKWELSERREREGLFFRRHPFGSVARVRLFYEQLLAGELEHFQYVRRGSRTINHAYPMCHFLCGVRHLLEPRSWLFVGKLEEYAADVVRLVKALGFGPGQQARLVNSSLETSNFAKLHPREVSNDTRYAVATATAMRAFHEDQTTRTAVCHLLRIDHACVVSLLPKERRYTLPPMCESTMGATMTAGSAAAAPAVATLLPDGRRSLAELLPRRRWHGQHQPMVKPMGQRLCIVVISAAPHAHLLPRVVSSVLASTLLPEQLVVALSGVGDAVCARANAAILQAMAGTPTMNLRLLCTEHMHSSGQNRNRGAAACGTSNASADEDAFISFIDSDDELLPTRSATITALMREHRADLGLHAYVGAMGCCHSPPRIVAPEEAARLYVAMPPCTRLGFTSECPEPPVPLTCRLRDACSTSRCAHMSSCIHFLPGSLTRVHYAHATVRASVFRSLKQREGAAYGKVEDSWFARDMAALGLRIVVTDEALTMYNRTSGHIQPPGLLTKAKPARSTGDRASDSGSSHGSSSGSSGGSSSGSSTGSTGSTGDPTRDALCGLARRLQHLLDRAITHGSWDNVTLRWRPFQDGTDESTADTALANRSVVLLGDSTARDMLAHLTGGPTAEPWRASAAWRVQALGCDVRIGSGCADCWACCTPNCSSSDAARAGRRSFIPYHKRVANTAYVHRGWQDFVYTRAASTTRIAFSWKPEAFSQSDVAAFSMRFCVEPPALLYVAKGLHDACRDQASTVEEVAEHATLRFRQLAHLLHCLPNSTLVVLRTPYFVSRHTQGSSNRVCHHADEEPARVAAMRDVLLQLHAERAFGTHVLLLDAYAVTRAADATGNPALRTIDGHHYPPAVRSLEWALLTHVLRAYDATHDVAHSRFSGSLS